MEGMGRCGKREGEGGEGRKVRAGKVREGRCGREGEVRGR
jgi:hypothetical protein